MCGGCVVVGCWPPRFSCLRSGNGRSCTTYKYYYVQVRSTTAASQSQHAECSGKCFETQWPRLSAYIEEYSQVLALLERVLQYLRVLVRTRTTLAKHRT